jgi:8-oxo-dGTP pyrophosphatase MutT (NUDIX family)
MGGGILPVAIKNGRIYFLFARETIGIYKDSGKWSDFGGSKENNETYFETAIREAWEETDGFFGDKQNISYLIRKKTIKAITWRGYRTYLVLVDYDKSLPHKFRRRFLKIKKNSPELISKKNCFFEKDKIKWTEYRNLAQKMEHFRPWYQNIVRKIIEEF